MAVVEEDITFTADGYPSYYWDPYWQPNTRKERSDIVNLGFVINVIESPKERADTLKEAWSLTNKLLVVSARVAAILS